MTGLRICAGAAPKGECELCLAWATGSNAREAAIGREDRHEGDRKMREDVGMSWVKARDMAAAGGNAEFW